MESCITSRENGKIKYACKLAQSAAFRNQEQSFFAEGLKLCLELARSPLHLKVIFYTEKALNKSPQLAQLPGEHYLVEEHVAQKLAQSQSSQGVFGIFELPAFRWEDLRPGLRLLALEGVQDPGNVGTLIRSAAAFGFDGVLLAGGCASPWSPKTLRASMGAAGQLPVLELPHMPSAIEQLNQMGYTTLAAALYRSQPLTGTPHAYAGGLCLVIGSEGQGLTPQTQEACTAAVRIPMTSRVESLNAGVAGSVLLWYFGTGEE